MQASKQEQRNICIERRRKLSDDERKHFSKIICEKLKALDEYKNAKCILSYKASFDEVNTDFIQSDNKVFCFPVSYAGGVMEARIPNAIDGWEEGRFGILSPSVQNSVLVNPEEIDIVIVPCVGFDASKKRLGHGKGYYDRYLPFCHNAKKIAIAFETQKLENVLTDEYDVEMTYIISETDIYR